MNVSDWLGSLGLERYVKAFEDHDVDAQTLRLLTEADLLEIGVKSVGHRRRLADAIAELAPSEHGPTPAPAPPLSASAFAPLPPTEAPALPMPAEGERRQLSVLYCAMGGPTPMVPGRHTEEVREAVRAFQPACTQVVAEYDGHVANFFGQCVLAYFGWPRAHEDDAERAVRAGLALARVLHRTGQGLRARVSIATGAVVVGRLDPDGPAQEQLAAGLVPDLAARILDLAADGQVVTDELTRQLAPVFAVQSLGRHAFEGIAEEVTAYAISGERPAESRFDARQGDELAPMVGREQELNLLMERWTQARDGEGQAVLLVGEAGIGKSRLARAVLDASGAQPHARLVWQCSPYHTGSALWPVIQSIGRAAGLGAQDSSDAALDKLEALVGPDHDSAALHATLLGLDGTRRYGPLEMAPQALRQRTLELLAKELLEMARRQGLVLVVEDAHWIDPTTLELVQRCLDRIERARLLLLITSRPEHQPELGGHPNVTRLSLNRLSRASVQAIVARLGGDSLQAHTMATIVAQAGGVPLFAEELTKTMLETGEATIPASLHGSLMARLDHLPEVKEVAQIAACIGREFDQALVCSVAERPELVPAALDRLAEAELVFRRGDKAGPRFTFKHALLQEAAYESLLRGRRQQIHARILEVLESQRPDTPSESLARHATVARLFDKAIGYWQQAGEAAMAKSAYVEAGCHLDRVIALIRAQPDATDRQEAELQAQLGLGQAHIAAHGFGAEVTRRTFVRAQELLGADTASASQRLRAQFGLWACHVNRDELDSALQMATQALSAARAGADPGLQLCAHRMTATSHFFLGELAFAQDHFNRALALMDRVRDLDLSAQFGVDPVIATHYCLGLALCLQGYPQQSSQLMQRAQGLCTPQTLLFTRGHMHVFRAMRAVCLRDVATARREAQTLAELAREHSLALLGAYSDALLGWSAELPGEDAIATCERGLRKLAATGTHLHDPFFLALLASRMAACGREPEAVRTIDRALTECERSRQGWCFPELWRMRGELAEHRQPGGDEALSCFDRALALARNCGAKLWELRAALSLARWWAGRGEHVKASELLAPVYGWFTEGFDTPDLVEARLLMGELKRAIGTS